MTLVAFDLDGTLEDSRVDMVAAVQRVRGVLGLPDRPNDDFRPHVNKGMPHLYRVCFEEFISKTGSTAVEELKALYVDDYAAHIADHTVLYPGIREVLDALSNRVTMAVVTNKPEGLSQHLLRTLGVDKFFASIIGGDTCETPKPTAAPLAEAARRSGESQVYMVGDSIGDIKCAQAFGAVSVWCAWGYIESTGDYVPDHRIDHPQELLKVLSAL